MRRLKRSSSVRLAQAIAYLTSMAFVLCLIGWTFSHDGSEVRPEREFTHGRDVEVMGQYRNWSGAVFLQNDFVELVVVPSIGRIIRFGPRGGPNLLWENPDLWGRVPPAPEERADWVNSGGDKVWPAPQERWGWPPDPWLDGSAYRTRRRSDGTVMMISPVSPRTGLRVVRVIRLDPTRPRVTIENILENHGTSPQTWSIWQVTQVDEPDVVEMPRSSGMYSQGYRVFPGLPQPGEYVRVEDGRVICRRSRRSAYKVGADAPRTVVSCGRSGWVFIMEGPKRTEGIYPDGGCNVEIFSNPDPSPYMEMEVLGPMEEIPAGGRIRLVTTWTLKRVSPKERIAP